MAHRSLDELIEKSLDGAASGPELRELERRLHDPAERQVFVACHRLNSWLESLLQEEAAVCSTQAVLQAIGQAPRRSRHPARLRWAAVAAALLLVGAVGLWSAFPRVPSAATSQAAAPHVAHPPATGTGIDLARSDDLSAEAAVSLFGLVTANAIK